MHEGPTENRLGELGSLYKYQSKKRRRQQWTNDQQVEKNKTDG